MQTASQAIEPLDSARATARTPTVLFLCAANRARSQMAEAILRHEAGDRFEVSSAGLRPAPIDPMVIEALAEIGIDTAGLRPKSVDEFVKGKRIDCAIIVCERDEEYCPRLYPFCYRVLHWPFEDPVAFEGNDDDRMTEFRHVRNQLQTRIREWIAENPFDDARPTE